MTKHNKKRNVGIVYEMLMNYITESVINNRHDHAKKAIKIIERRYNKNTELYKEFRLLNALVNTSVSGTHIAAGILAESKMAARKFDAKRLMKEKSLLIKDINYQLKESNFYNRHVPNYKIYATIQTLINEWGMNDRSNLSKMIEYEKIAVEHLISEKKETAIQEFDERSDALVFKILSEKINQKYNDSLTNEQKEIIRNYAIYANDDIKLFEYLNDLKEAVLKEMSVFKSKTQNQVLLSKIDMVYNKINEVDVNVKNDDTIKKFMTITKLKDQLISGE